MDFLFSYKNVYRFLLINQWSSFFNTNQLPFLKKILVFFKIYNLTDLDDVRSFNYAYLIRFFFGKKVFFHKYSTRFHLGIHYFSFSVNCVFFNQHHFLRWLFLLMIFCLFLLINFFFLVCYIQVKFFLLDLLIWIFLLKRKLILVFII